MSGKVEVLPPHRTSEAVERVCGTQVPDTSLRIGTEGGLENGVVYLDGPFARVAPASQAKGVIDQERCAFVPRVLALPAGALVEFRNSDPLTHNVRATQSTATLFNFAMPLEGMKAEKRLSSEPTLTRIRCDVHPWMGAIIRTFTHPYYSVTDAQGRFTIPDVPAGQHKLIVWHERFPEESVEVEVPVDGARAVEVAFEAARLLH